MHWVLIKVVRFFLRIGLVLPLHTLTWLPSTMLSYLTATCLSSDTSSPPLPEEKLAIHQLGSGTVWSLTCRVLLYFSHLHMLSRWQSISSFNQLPKVPVIAFHSAMRFLLHCFPAIGAGLGASSFTTAVEPVPGHHVPLFPEALEKVRVTNAASWKFLAPKAPPLCLPSLSCRWIYLQKCRSLALLCKVLTFPISQYLSFWVNSTSYL